MMKGKPLLETCEFLSMTDFGPGEINLDTYKGWVKLFKQRAKTVVNENAALITSPDDWDRL